MRAFFLGAAGLTIVAGGFVFARTEDGDLGCVNPTLEDARQSRVMTVDAWIDGLEDNGTLHADQKTCRQRLIIRMRGSSPQFQRLRVLFREAVNKSDGLYLVSARLTGTLSVSPPFPEREGMADVTLNVTDVTDAKVVPYR